MAKKVVSKSKVAGQHPPKTGKVPTTPAPAFKKGGAKKKK